MNDPTSTNILNHAPITFIHMTQGMKPTLKSNLANPCTPFDSGLDSDFQPASTNNTINSKWADMTNGKRGHYRHLHNSQQVHAVIRHVNGCNSGLHTRWTHHQGE